MKQILTPRDEYAMIYSDKILELIYAWETGDITTSDIQGMTQALALRMYDQAQNNETKETI